MKLCRFQTNQTSASIGVVAYDEQTVVDLTTAGVEGMTPLLEGDRLTQQVAGFAKLNLPRHSLLVMNSRAQVVGFTIGNAHPWSIVSRSATARWRNHPDGPSSIAGQSPA